MPDIKSVLDQIKDEYAREAYGYEDWEIFLVDNRYHAIKIIEEAWAEISRRYATACCKATQERCAKNAQVVPAEGYMFRQVLDMRTILSPENIVLL